MSEYGMVMPFVVCKTNGGPYDDVSFVAGARMEAISNRCERGEDPVEGYEPTPLLPQLDLVAMRYGYAMSCEAWEGSLGEWTFVTLTRVCTPDPD